MWSQESITTTPVLNGYWQLKIKYYSDGNKLEGKFATEEDCREVLDEFVSGDEAVKWKISFIPFNTVGDFVWTHVD